MAKNSPPTRKKGPLAKNSPWRKIAPGSPPSTGTAARRVRLGPSLSVFIDAETPASQLDVRSISLPRGPTPQMAHPPLD